jgi:ferredoxin-NADP reductase
MVTKNQQIELLVKYSQSETPDYMSTGFHRPKNFTFEAGDWIDIEFDGQSLNGGKTYSLSSSPTEGDLKITFREGISELKKAMSAAQPGDKLFITQYGNDYKFQLNKSRASTLIAGGVGIAPFRSMLKEMYDHNDKNEVSLIYLNQNENFLFKEELELWSQKLTNLSIIYIPTKDLNRKRREKLLLSLIKSPEQNFYISGPPAMVESNEHLLIDHKGVLVRNIRVDSFGGY